MEEDLRADIENAVLPTFINEAIQSVEWGQPCIKQETAFVRIVINGKPYILVEDDTDGSIRQGDPASWLDDYLQEEFHFSETDMQNLGALPTKALKSKKPSMSDWISMLEYHDGHPIHYMLFEV